MGKLAQFVAEARRRRVFRTAGLYIVGAWVLLQVVDLALESFGQPEGLMRYFWLAALVGFPVALIFGWYYELTPSGIVKTAVGPAPQPESLALKVPDYLILGALAIVVAIVGAGLMDRLRHGSELLVYDPSGVAVLPLTDLSGDEEQAYFSAGMQDALISSLGRIGALKVVSRRSTLRIDDSMPMPSVGRLLGVRNIMEGSVIREGPRVRIILQLVDAASDTQIWSGNFERELSGVFGMQNDIANAVAEAVEVQLTSEEESRLAEQPVIDPGEYDAYLRGMYRIHSDSNLVRRQGITILRKAVEQYPDSALLHDGMAYGYALLGHSPYPEGMYPASVESARRALAIDPNNALAHVAVGMQKMYYEWDYAAGENSLRHALELNSALPQAHYHLAWLYELYRDSERSIPPGEESVEIDPLDPFVLGWLAEQYRSAGRHDDALRISEQTLELEPDHPVALRTKALTYADMGEFELALEASSRIAEHPMWRFTHGVVLALSGDETSARAVLDSYERKPFNVLPLIRLHATLGDTEEVFHWLGVARDVKLPWYPWFLTWYPQMDAHVLDPRMRELAREIGIEHIYDEAVARLQARAG
jgi:TolB-like protein/Flp pilus assembly protein TadD